MITLNPDAPLINSSKAEPYRAYMDKGHPGMYALGATVTLLSAAAYITPFFVLFPLAIPIQTVALGVLTAVSYGIINDQIACRQCIHYFTVGHTPVHKRLLKTNNPTLNGIVWGIHATWELGLLGGVAMAIATRATKLVALNVIGFTPAAVLLIIGTCAYAHIKSKQIEAKWHKYENQLELDQFFNGVILPEAGFHPVELSYVPVDKRAAWKAVSERNKIGYAILPAAGVIMVIGSIAARILLTVL